MAFRCNPLFFMSSTKSFLVTAQALPSFSLRSESELSRSSLLVYVKGAHSGALFWFEPLRCLVLVALGLSAVKRETADYYWLGRLTYLCIMLNFPVGWLFKKNSGL